MYAVLSQLFVVYSVYELLLSKSYQGSCYHRAIMKPYSGVPGGYYLPDSSIIPSVVTMCNRKIVEDIRQVSRPDVEESPHIKTGFSLQNVNAQPFAKVVK